MCHTLRHYHGGTGCGSAHKPIKIVRNLADPWSDLKNPNAHDRHVPRIKRAGSPLPVQEKSLIEWLISHRTTRHFGQMGDRLFGMLCGHIGVTGLAMLDGFLEMFDPFIQMRTLHTGRFGMLE